MKHAHAPGEASATHGDGVFRLLVDGVVDHAIYLLDPLGTVQTWNRGAARLKGFKASEIIGQSYSRFFTSEDRARGLPVTLLGRAASEGLAQSEGWRVRKDGTRFWASTTVTAIRDDDGTLTGFAKVTHDATERHHAELRARRLSSLQAARAEINQAIVRTREPEAVFELACQILVERGGFHGAWISTEVANDPRAEACREEALRLGYGEYRSWPLLAGGLTHATLHLHAGEPSFFEPDILAVLDELVHDLEFAVERSVREARRLATEQSLRESEGRYRSLVEHSPDAIFVNTDGRVELVNQAALRLFGADRAEDLLGRTPYELFHPDYHDVIRERIGRLRDHGEPVPAVHEKIVRLDGTALEVEVLAAPFQNGEARSIHVILRDQTDRTELYEQLLHAQKMESVGRLAGGIAHDFNNVLTVINSYAELASELLGTDSPVRDMLEQIERAGERAASLTRQLLAFSRRQVTQPVALDLNVLISDMEPMIRRLIGTSISLTVRTGATPSLVRADAGQIEQVVMNLVVNARDAMPDGGSLRIETAEVELDETYTQRHTGSKPGPHAMLAITDTGMGIDEATRHRVFEPFFTTKAQGRGTGLGLSTVYGIVKQHGGNIWLYSEPGRGTAFKIYLPRIDGEDVRMQAQEPDEAPTGGSETLLLVEDDDDVRDVTRRVLEAHGYRVLSASRGREALSLLESEEGPVHLMITDLMMPEMSGQELAAGLRVTHPGLRVLFTSGFTDDAVIREGAPTDPAQFLAKPYSVAALTRKVREVFERGPEG